MTNTSNTQSRNVDAGVEVRYPFQDLRTTNSRHAAALKEAAARVIDSGWYLHGPELRRFEESLARYVGSGHAIGNDNGLNAISLIFTALIELGRLRPGDRVATAANTFIAGVLPLTRLGLEVVPVEPDEETFGIDLSRLERELPEGVKAVVVTHLYGNPIWDEAAASRLRERGVTIVEDAAQALGAMWRGRPVCSLGDAAAISFYPAKNLGALGDSGAVCTSDDALAATVRTLADYGQDRKYHHLLRGYNSRMDELQAAFLAIKLADLDEENRRRDTAARAYDEAIDHPEVRKPRRLEGCRQTWHQYVVRSQRRDELAAHLRREGVETLIHYPIPPHLQPCYEGHFATPLPLTERLAGEVLSLPIANVTAEQAREISEIINRFK